MVSADSNQIIIISILIIFLLLLIAELWSLLAARAAGAQEGRWKFIIEHVTFQWFKNLVISWGIDQLQSVYTPVLADKSGTVIKKRELYLWSAFRNDFDIGADPIT